jgi:hypothetical protein
VEGTTFDTECDAIESIIERCFKDNGSLGVLVLRVEAAAADNQACLCGCCQ